MTEIRQTLDPLPYHVALRDSLRAGEPEAWSWFASVKAQEDYAQSLRLELLKHTYRLAPEAHGDLYARAEDAKARLGLTLPVTLYQAQETRERNATLYHLPGEVHIAFQGDVLALLAPGEWSALIGHELAHALLWQREGGDFMILDRMTQAMAMDPRAAPSHLQSARRLQLYTEIFADRGALLATGDVHTVVASLVKMQTGMRDVSAESYLAQAEEIFATAQPASEEVSHPEAFLRARALRLWAEREPGADREIARMIEGPLALDKLDLLGQARLTALTRRFLAVYLRPRWFQTEAVLGQARLLFDDFQPPAPDHADAGLAAELQDSDARTREYFCYLMLDFAARDPELERVPLAAAFELAERLDLTKTLEELANRELRLTRKELTGLRRSAAELLAATEARHP